MSLDLSRDIISDVAGAADPGRLTAAQKRLEGAAGAVAGEAVAAGADPKAAQSWGDWLGDSWAGRTWDELVRGVPEMATKGGAQLGGKAVEAVAPGVVGIVGNVSDKLDRIGSIFGRGLVAVVGLVVIAAALYAVARKAS